MTPARVAAGVALVAAIAAGAAAWTWRTGAVGGSDSACYALMTAAYADGRWQPESALAREAPWPDATRTTAPGGFLPSADRVGAAVPVCAPGYGLLLAPFARLAGRGVVYVVPALATAACAWLAFLLGRRLDSPWAGAAAAALVAAHPIVWFQAVQPMNDITTGALWLAVAVAAIDGRALTTGSLVGLGLLVRPNLAPAAVAAVVVCAIARAAAGERTGRGFVATAAFASLAAAPGVAGVLMLNASLYGSPWRSGYGDLERLFALEHVPVNLARYGGTWLATSTPLVLAALAAPLVLGRDRRWRAWGVLGLAAALSVVYLAYRPFPEWWYLRFLLPAVVLSLVLAASVLTASLRRLGGGAAGTVAVVVLAALWASWMLGRPEAGEARELRRLESRFATTAETVARVLPADAVAITGWQSGPIRFGPGREIVMWDALDPAWLDRAVAWLEAHGRTPALVLEGWEEEGFRTRFAGQAFGALDWPPRYDLDRRVRIYLPADRARATAGQPVHTEFVFGRRPRAAR